MERLNFGCGNNIKRGWVNVDKQEGEGINKSFDFNKFPYPFKKDSFDYVLIDNVLEHLEKPVEVIKELHRICKKNAIIEIIVPYYNTYYAYVDVTHLHFFNEDTFYNLFEGNKYDIKKKNLFKVLEVNSIPQRYLRWIPKPILNVLKRFLGNIIVNLNVKVRVIKLNTPLSP
ncbi:class I SAM-dependent methyltransferase [Candidatus Woesearchaeota archaeon]|nr:class I SAM-dependent methyltransferase [Candidatus Woesearchaeota archaeon]